MIAALQESAQTKTGMQIIVGLARAVAISDNAHTRLYLLRNRSELRRYPIRVWWFSDGLYVIKARAEYSEMLGAKVLRIGGHTPEQVKKAVDPLYAGNGPWLKYISTYTMTSPDVLYGLGLVGADGLTEIEFLGRDGRKSKRTISPLPLRKSNQPTEAWWDLSPLHPGVDGPWQSALPADASRLPLYLRNPVQQYWSEYLPDSELLYLQYNRADNQPGGEPLAAFGKRFLEELQTKRAKKVVVDLRLNTGGNLQVARSFLQNLASACRAMGIRPYVITGPATFSAGLYHAAQLRQDANAIIVGEPAGEVLDFWSEGGNLLMPNSKLTLHYADRFHSYSRIERPEVKPFLDADLNIDSLNPKLLLKLSSRDYFAGRDLALESIIAQR